MKNNLNLSELKQRDKLLQKIEDASAALSKAVSNFETFRCDVVDEIESSHEDASDSWSESAFREAHAAWRELWGTILNAMDGEECDSACDGVETCASGPEWPS